MVGYVNFFSLGLFVWGGVFLDIHVVLICIQWAVNFYSWSFCPVIFAWSRGKHEQEKAGRITFNKL